MKKVSVIIPTYNTEKYIIQAINSVISQTYQNIEIIVLDDGSTDNTKKLLQPMIEQNQIVYFWQENAGLSIARNAGLAQATGEYIAFLDADDEFFPEKIAKQIAYFDNHPDAMMTHTDYVVVDEMGNDLGYRKTDFYEGHKYPEILLAWQGPVAPSTWVFRQEVFQKIGNFNELKGKGQDLIFIVKFSREYAFHRISEGLMLRRIHDSNISNNWNFDVTHWEDNFQHIFEQDDTLGKTFKKKVLARMFANQSLMLIKLNNLNNKEQMRQYSLKAIKYWPFDWQAYLGLIASFIQSPILRKTVKLWQNFKYRA